MTPEDRQTIIVYRLERAEESLQAARLLRENNMLIPAMNRIYYAMLYAVQAVLARGGGICKTWAGQGLF